jgi:adenylate cyclase
VADRHEQRRLAAILVADVVGYSRLMEVDESDTLAAVHDRQTTILEPIVQNYGGRIVKTMGDGVLAEFASALNSVKAAVELQQQFGKANLSIPSERHILLRIGINLGDVIGQGADIYGDAVNLAARLEQLANDGGICISAKVYNEIRGKIDASYEDIGDQKVKNISLPVRAYRVNLNAAGGLSKPFLALPDRPSLAVLPFLNISSDLSRIFLWTA